MIDRQCCICGKTTFSSKYLFCKQCYQNWYLLNQDKPWIKFLMSQEQSRSRIESQTNFDISIEELENNA